ncbi:bile acid:sodium symporter [Comamonas serinivorans]|uniref:Bile acid:sodium symporter n=1 Tax=Comamonas serinivorans TaxID=1082851 RepID=A0A1Y0ETH7_9BURK|nr:bile acid:sodium symporter family protein [Comamonas serinivorans]ARU06903.1 bile acid:sodium symporter [Comamonas serinivorans]
MSRPRFLPDNFTLLLITVVLLASFVPVYGQGAQLFEAITTVAIGLLFFLHGAKLSREAIIGGITHWRLHVLIMLCTFALFPLLGWALRPVLQPLVTPDLYVGVLYLCVLPATVQSAIAFTAMARGNVAAAICSASASTLLGVFITPVLVNLLVVPGQHAGQSLDAVGKILLQLLLPFVVGHLMRPWVGEWVKAHAKLVKVVDQGSILLVVYAAFSAAVVAGLWRETPWPALIGLVVLCCVLLAVVLVSTTLLARKLGFSKEDEITIVFCGSKKSLASGVPMAQVLFPAAMAGPVLLPVMLFHQIQLMVCAQLALRYGRRPD